MVLNSDLKLCMARSVYVHQLKIHRFQEMCGRAINSLTLYKSVFEIPPFPLDANIKIDKTTMI